MNVSLIYTKQPTETHITYHSFFPFLQGIIVSDKTVGPVEYCVEYRSFPAEETYCIPVRFLACVTVGASSGTPSLVPSSQPSGVPSSDPSRDPSSVPSLEPSSKPSLAPSLAPSAGPSSSPSSLPSEVPSKEPSSTPSRAPSSVPSLNPSQSPSSQPSEVPSLLPSLAPSGTPSLVPSSKPSLFPSSQPSSAPSSEPTIDCPNTAKGLFTLKAIQNEDFGYVSLVTSTGSDLPPQCEYSGGTLGKLREDRNATEETILGPETTCAVSPNECFFDLYETTNRDPHHLPFLLSVLTGHYRL
jgi:hypothetical protein